LGRRSYPQARPASNDLLRIDTVDDDELLAAGGPRDESDRALGDTELVGQQSYQRLVRGTTHGRGGDTGPEHAVDDPLDMVESGTRGQANGETDVAISQGSAQPSLVGRTPGMDRHRPSLPVPP
jgi:hypothetical protein